MRKSYGPDWAFGVRGAIENVVRNSFPGDLRVWPLLKAFNFETYVIGNCHFVIVLRDKLCGIPFGSEPKPFPHADHPPLPVTLDTVDVWQSYLMVTFTLRIEDAAMILPIHDSGQSKASEDYKLFTSDEKAVWDHQLRSTVARQMMSIQSSSAPPPDSPTHVTYNIATGPNARINNNSADSSINIVEQQVPEVLEQLLSAIQTANVDHPKSKDLERSVVEMQKAFGEQSFGECYRSFMSSFADHIQVFGPIVAQYLASLAKLVG